MSAFYFLVAFIIFLFAMLVYYKVTRKPLSETILASFSTTLVALLTREMFGEVEGHVDVDFYFFKGHELNFHIGGVGLDYYFGVITAFLATFLAAGVYLYSKKYNLES